MTLSRRAATVAEMETTHLVRLIFSIELDLSPPPGSPPSASLGIVIPLGRDGNATGRNGRPGPPKTRTIDLRPGDEVMIGGRWRRVLGIRAYRQTHGSPQQVEAIGDGYVIKSRA
jgi:hypothetical protein